MTVANPNAKQAQREMLNKLIAEYLAHGGIIHGLGLAPLHE